MKLGDTVVIVATNQDGSVNGKQFTVSGILESATGPGAGTATSISRTQPKSCACPKWRSARSPLRLKDFNRLSAIEKQLDGPPRKEVNQEGRPLFEVHSWEKLSPFFNIARMIDVMTVFIKIMLIAIVLISIMNVMLMAVYERIREIGTIAAIGTLPGKILSMFVLEGFFLGVAGAFIGDLVGTAIILAVNLIGFRFDFAQQQGLLLTAAVRPADLLVVSLIVIAVAVAASLQPAYKASRMEPITALRHV